MSFYGGFADYHAFELPLIKDVGGAGHQFSNSNNSRYLGLKLFLSILSKASAVELSDSSKNNVIEPCILYFRPS